MNRPHNRDITNTVIVILLHGNFFIIIILWIGVCIYV